MRALAGPFWLGHRHSTATPVATASVEATFTQLTTLKGTETFPSLSPDGKWLVYNSAVGSDVGTPASGQNAQIYLQRVGGQTPINLTRDSPDDDWSPTFSSDGERIAFRSERAGGGLFVMGRTGDAVKRITDTGFNPAWSPSGEEIVFGEDGVNFNPQLRGRVSGLSIVNVATGEKRRITAGDAVQPQWSPHGYRIAYWASRGGQRDIATIPAAGGEPVFLTDDTALDWNPIWSPDGQYLAVRSPETVGGSDAGDVASGGDAVGGRIGVARPGWICREQPKKHSTTLLCFILILSSMIATCEAHQMARLRRRAG
jgi:Tol biopolymer transport system component